jgi:hypothetical protein
LPAARHSKKIEEGTAFSARASSWRRPGGRLLIGLCRYFNEDRQLPSFTGLDPQEVLLGVPGSGAYPLPPPAEAHGKRQDSPVAAALFQGRRGERKSIPAPPRRAAPTATQNARRMTLFPTKWKETLDVPEQCASVAGAST